MTIQKVIERVKQQESLINSLEQDEKCIILAALGKQIHRKPTKTKNEGFRYTDAYICPSCGKHFSGTGIADYCYHCGQALDWSGENRNTCI